MPDVDNHVVVKRFGRSVKAVRKVDVIRSQVCEEASNGTVRDHTDTPRKPSWARAIGSREHTHFEIASVEFLYERACGVVEVGRGANDRALRGARRQSQQ